jgi:hypothetical protein
MAVEDASRRRLTAGGSLLLEFVVLAHMSSEALTAALQVPLSIF